MSMNDKALSFIKCIKIFENNKKKNKIQKSSETNLSQ
jgi:hypothetical protein